MGSFHQSKRSDNKWYTVEVRWGIFIENLTYFWSSHSWSLDRMWLGLYRYGWGSRTFRNITIDSIYILIQGWISMTQLLLEHSWRSHYRWRRYGEFSIVERSKLIDKKIRLTSSALNFFPTTTTLTSYKREFSRDIRDCIYLQRFRILASLLPRFN